MGIIDEFKERRTKTYRVAAVRLNEIATTKGYFTNDDVDNALVYANDYDNCCGLNYIEKVVSDTFDKVMNNNIKSVYCSSKTNDICQLVRNNQSFLLYDIEVIGNILIIWWKYEKFSGNIGPIINPTEEELFDAIKDILSKIKHDKDLVE